MNEQQTQQRVEALERIVKVLSETLSVVVSNQYSDVQRHAFEARVEEARNGTKEDRPSTSSHHYHYER